MLIACWCALTSERFLIWAPRRPPHVICPNQLLSTMGRWSLQGVVTASQHGYPPGTITYPVSKVAGKMIFLFHLWDMFVPRRVSSYWISPYLAYFCSTKNAVATPVLLWMSSRWFFAHCGILVWRPAFFIGSIVGHNDCSYWLLSYCPILP